MHPLPKNNKVSVNLNLLKFTQMLENKLNWNVCNTLNRFKLTPLFLCLLSFKHSNIRKYFTS